MQHTLKHIESWSPPSGDILGKLSIIWVGVFWDEFVFVVIVALGYLEFILFFCWPIFRFWHIGLMSSLENLSKGGTPSYKNSTSLFVFPISSAMRPLIRQSVIVKWSVWQTHLNSSFIFWLYFSCDVARTNLDLWSMTILKTRDSIPHSVIKSSTRLEMFSPVCESSKNRKASTGDLSFHSVSM